MDTSNLIEKLNWRYAVKKFDSQKKIDAKTWDALEEALVLSPSSYGLQPWKFLVIDDKATRQKLTPAAYNQTQIADCSHLVVIAVKEKMDEEHVDKYIQQIIKVRGTDAATLEGFKKVMMGDVVNGPRSKVAFEWCARQGYIALGNLLTTCAMAGVDACPMEGFDPAKFDEILGLGGTGWRSVVVCTTGYRATDDAYAKQKKVRFDRAEVIKHV